MGSWASPRLRPPRGSSRLFITAVGLVASIAGVAGAGNLYIVDTGNHRVRKVDTDGRISTVAGTGTAGFSGDGGPATRARLNAPHGIASDAAGNLYVADPQNQRIRRIDASTGTITTVAGNGARGSGGDGGPATRAALDRPRDVAVDAGGNLYVATEDDSRVRR